MASILSTQIRVIAVEGVTERVVLLGLSGVTAADTLEFSSSGPLPATAQLRKVRTAEHVLPTSGAAVAGVITGTSVAIGAGPSNDDGWLLVTGEA